MHITAVFKDPVLTVTLTLLVTLSVFVLFSIAPFLFPGYFFFLVVAIGFYLLFSNIDFDILAVFYKHLYVASIFFLLLPLVIGQVTRGAIRWIPLGTLTLQPSEIVRPFLLVFFACYLTEKKPDLRKIIKATLLLALPFFLILIQPSLGVSVLTVLGFVGIILALDIDKRYLLVGFLIFIALLPVSWQLLAPYQRLRVESFLDPASDPLGAGYNSLQSMISVGSGMFLGRGLGKGIQTQLAFLPERHTDFIFASVGEELGFVGAVLLLVGLFVVFWRISQASENAMSIPARAFISGLFITLLAQTVINIGMNMGLLPITGVPLPLISAGGSSFLATMIGLGIVVGATKKKSAPSLFL